MNGKKKDIPEKRLSAIGRLPSDIDGDEPRHRCIICCRSDWESNMRIDVNKFGTSWFCRRCENV